MGGKEEGREKKGFRMVEKYTTPKINQLYTLTDGREK